MKTHADMSGLVELYALGALESAEMSEFEIHLETCDNCRSKVDEALAVIAMLVPDTEAPEEVWSRIVAEMNPNVVPLGRRRRPWVALTAVAASLSIVLAGVLATQGDRAPGDQIAAAAEEAADDPGSIVADLADGSMAFARIVLAADGRGFVIPTEDLPPLDESRTYQLWVVNTEGQVISGGVLGSHPGPSTFTWAGGVSGFALTREVAGGVETSAGDVIAAVTDI